MAKAVLELIANTEGWNGGIKKAEQALTNFINANGGLHKVLAEHDTVFNKAIAKFGELGSKSNTIQGRIKELTAAYVKLGDVFNSMTKEEREMNGANVAAQMKKIRVEIERTQMVYDKLNNSLSMPKKVDNLNMSEQIKSLTNEYMRLAAAYRNMSDEEKKMHGSTVATKMKQIRAEIVSTKEAMDKFNNSLKIQKKSDPLDMAAKVKRLTNEYLRLGAAMSQMSMKESKLHGAKTQARMRELRAEILKTKSAMEKLNGDLMLGGNRFGNSGFMGGFGAIFQGNIAAGAVMNSIRMLGEGLRNAVQTNIEFEQSNATLASVLGKTTDEVIKLTNNAKYLGATTVWTAGQITELQTVLARRGFREEQILAMTKGISSLATATGVELAEAAELAAGAMQSFELKSTKMDEVVATLGVSTTKSALDMEKLRYAFAYVAPAAHAAGFSIEEAVAMLGALADAGIPATTTGMATRNTLIDLTDASSRLGKAIGHPVHSMDEFLIAMEELKKKGYNNLESIAQLVDARVVPAFSVFMNNTEKMRQLRDEITNVEDELQSMVDNQIDTMQGDITLLTSAWDGLMLSFENSMQSMRPAIQGITTLINKLTELRNATRGGDAAITQLEKGVTNEDKAAQKTRLDDLLKKATVNGKVDPEKAILVLTQEMQDTKAGFDIGVKYRDSLRSQYDEMLAGENKSKNARAFENIMLWFTNPAAAIANKTISDTAFRGSREELEQEISDNNDLIAKEQYYMDLVKEALDENMRILEDAKNARKKATGGGDSDAQDRVDKALRAYEIAITKAALEKEAGYINEEEYTKKRLRAEETLYGVYADLAAEFGDEDWKKNMHNEAIRVRELAESAENLRRAREEAAEAEREEAQRLKAQRALDYRILNGLERTASNARKSMTDDMMGGQSTMEYFGLSGIKNRMTADLQLDITDEEWTELVAKINEKLQSINLPKIELDLETGVITKLGDSAKATAQAFGYVTSSIQSIGSALQSLEDPGAKVMGIIANAIATTAMGFAQASAADAKFGVLPWIAASAAGVANMTAMIAAIKSATEYHAQGGFVGMNGMSPFKPMGSDVVPAMLTPGEIVLNRAQQSNIANQLQGVGMHAIQVNISGKIHGQDILLSAENYNRLHGGGRGVYASIK